MKMRMLEEKLQKLAVKEERMYTIKIDGTRQGDPKHTKYQVIGI